MELLTHCAVMPQLLTPRAGKEAVCGCWTAPQHKLHPRRLRQSSAFASFAQPPHSDEEQKRGDPMHRRSALVAALVALALPSLPALAEETTASATDAAAANVTPIYFGNGCFWGRQKDFVDVEMLRLGRQKDEVSAVVGYAGGAAAVGPDGKVCYYYAPKETIYERLGHAEVVQLELSGDGDSASKQMAAMSDMYFKQFQKTPAGMQRLDPQDAGPGYRNVIGIPGGVDSPLFKVLQERNKYGMQLVAGNGNQWINGQPTEDDQVNTIYVLDSDKFPFYRAEQYHQFHNGLGKAFPKEYTQGMKDVAKKTGRIGPTGCPEYFFF